MSLSPLSNLKRGNLCARRKPLAQASEHAGRSGNGRSRSERLLRLLPSLPLVSRRPRKLRMCRMLRHTRPRKLLITQVSELSYTLNSRSAQRFSAPAPSGKSRGGTPSGATPHLAGSVGYPFPQLQQLVMCGGLKVALAYTRVCRERKREKCEKSLVRAGARGRNRKGVRTLGVASLAML
jgi:hypothetical protein